MGRARAKAKTKKTAVKTKKTKGRDPRPHNFNFDSISEAPMTALAIAAFGRVTGSFAYVRAQKQLQMGPRNDVFTFADSQKGGQMGGQPKRPKNKISKALKGKPKSLQQKKYMCGPKTKAHRENMKNNNNVAIKGPKTLVRAPRAL